MHAWTTILILTTFAAGAGTSAQDGLPTANYCVGNGPGSCFCDCEEPGTAPCGNEGDVNNGCGNGTNALGGNLDASGRVDPDTVVLIASMCTPGEFGVFFQGSQVLNNGRGVPFGDGLHCTGVDTIRIEFVTLDFLGRALSTVSISDVGGTSPGELRFYQLLYRDPQLTPCGFGFNLTNGYKISW